MSFLASLGMTGRIKKAEDNILGLSRLAPPLLAASFDCASLRSGCGQEGAGGWGYFG